MIGFILTGHGHFSNGLKSAIDMVAGEQPAFEIVPFEGDKAGEYADTLRAVITKMAGECEGVLVFVDLLGGTPFNQSMLVSADVDNMAVVAGTNLPMLVELIMTRSFGDPTLGELVEKAVQVGKDGVTTMTLGAAAADDDEDDEM
ncbi:PTS fructose transporter subunit IIA [Collinsella sp. An7]|uniref:PTS sugar transporter subunit IIA n=1 Tax=Collinsella sp. An7 TaxID=1965651 RepID=UPI000B3A8020|nr:PTS sugar transporter subunit IIA [Collinsella sp. An7]OUN47631.1 PTS fructose transporter subunit IIA [Collinsella sp. An7]